MSDEEFIALVKAGDAKGVADALAKSEGLAFAKDASGVPSLMTAIYFGHHTIAESIAAAKKGDLDVFEATLLGRCELVRTLVSKDKSSLDAFSGDGFTPLHYAAYFGQSEAASALVEAGASPAHLSRNAMKVSALHSALAAGHLDIARLLIANGADVTQASGDGWTPLHYAADLGDAQIARELIARGAKGGAPNADGETAEELGRRVGHDHVSELIEMGATA